MAGAIGSVLALLLASHTAHAQSLQDLYTAARTYDAAYLAATAQAASIEFRAAQAYALKRPGVNLAATVGRANTNPPPSALNPTGATINSSTSGVTLNARMPLWNRQSDATIDQANKSLEVAQTDLALAEHDLILRLAQAYFDVLGAEDVLTAARASERAIAEQLASAKRNFEVGTATITDAREAQARADLVAAQKIAAENDLRIKQLALDQLVGSSGVRPHRLVVPTLLPQVTPATLQPWIDQAETQHPASRRAALAFDVAKLETRKAVAGHQPTVDLVGNAGPSRAINNGFGGNSTVASVGLQLNVPIYAGESITNRVRETTLLEERAANDWTNTRRTLAQQARAAFITVESGRAQVQALEAAEASSRLALEATQTGYRVGVRVNVDVLNAQTQLFQTQRDVALARNNVLLGTLRLRQAAGSLSPGDLAALDALLLRPR